MATVALACIMAIVLGATNAQATILTVGDSYYLGRISDGAPADPSNEVLYINSLLALAAGALATPCPSATSENCDRVNSSFDATSSPQAVTPGNQRVEFNDDYNGSAFDVTGFTYLLAKYDGRNPGAGSYVWVVSGLTSVSIPTMLPGPDKYNLSHYSLYNPVSVPDSGMTVMLLGGALAGLEVLRRRRRIRL